jgi:adenine phosphoribosyltransferase
MTARTPPLEAAPSPGELEAELRRTIRDIPDFPKPGIVFKDITPVLLDAGLFRRTACAMAAPFAADGVTHVAGIESRGFILGAPIALELGAAFVPVRKPGKLPALVERVDYALEYGIDALEVHRDALGAGHRVLLVDDVLATGGTAAAACEVLERLGAEVVGCTLLMVLSFLEGQGRLKDRRVSTLITY